MDRMNSPLKRRVLVIEDDPDVRKLITESLRAAGLDALPAVDGAQFVARWRERRPDSRDVPIVVISGHPDRREVGGLIGAVKVFGKPFEVDELVGTVDRVLN